MNKHHRMFLMAVCMASLALAACDSSSHGDAAPVAPTAAGATTAGPATPAASASGAATETVIPAGFSSYASESIGDGRQCVVGAAVDEDGMNQKPVVYIEQTSGKPVWTRTLELPKDTYQSRATHCLHQEDALYVLLQSDTQPQQSLSQTLLRVVELDAGNGAVRGGGDVAVPGAQGAYSAVVAEGAQHLRWDDGQLIVAGQYFLLDAPDQRIDFQATFKADLGR